MAWIFSSAAWGPAGRTLTNRASESRSQKVGLRSAVPNMRISRANSVIACGGGDPVLFGDVFVRAILSPGGENGAGMGRIELTGIDQNTGYQSCVDGTKKPPRRYLAGPDSARTSTL